MRLMITVPQENKYEYISSLRISYIKIEDMFLLFQFSITWDENKHAEMENIQSQCTVLLTHGIVNQLSSLGSVCFDIY